jgi:hypothetical protein
MAQVGLLLNRLKGHNMISERGGIIGLLAVAIVIYVIIHTGRLGIW